MLPFFYFLLVDLPGSLLGIFIVSSLPRSIFGNPVILFEFGNVELIKLSWLQLRLRLRLRMSYHDGFCLLYRYIPSILSHCFCFLFQNVSDPQLLLHDVSQLLVECHVRPQICLHHQKRSASRKSTCLNLILVLCVLHI
jgi:hypothetical protein